MIIDFHMHPLCKEASIVPGVDGVIERLFADNPESPAKEGLKGTLTALFTQRSASNIIEDMDRLGIDKGVIVGMDLSTAFGVEMVTDFDIHHLTEMYPDRFIPFIGIDPAQGQVAVDKLVSAVKLTGCHGVKLHPELQGLDFSNRTGFHSGRNARNWESLSGPIPVHNEPCPGKIPVLHSPCRSRFWRHGSND